MARVLVVDDSIAMRKNIKMFLKDLGHEVVSEASNGKEAFREYKKYLPDIVTMDISMPTLDGIGSVRMILDEFPEASIIMITALGQRSSVYEAVKSGAKGYIVKPIDQKKLKEIIDSVLSNPNKGNPAAKRTEIPEIIVQPFTIENVLGKFIVKISENIDTASFKSLCDALKGIMYIKPLDISFDFGDSKNVNQEILNRISQIVDNINSTGEKAVLLYTEGIRFL